MKRILVASFVLVTLIACGGNDSKDGKKEEKTDNSGTSDISSNPDYQKGLALVGQSDCFTCHTVSEPKTGPTYTDVANKYAGGGDSAFNYLVHKIINGGTGVWGQVPMIPHPQVSEEDAKAMVKYILLLKK
ncbi:MAG TPA: c-type cytochrome [Chitinophagaceae bacterium]|nr:c-type cytochrome [Chitinophagaceae bacterium]